MVLARQTLLACVVGAALTTCPASPARAEPAVDRSGIVLEGGFGLGYTQLPNARSIPGVPPGEDGYWGPAGLAIGVGGYVSPRAAILVRLSGTSFRPMAVRPTVVAIDTSTFIHTHGSEGKRLANAFLGIGLQYWSTQRLAFGLGLGVAAFGRSSLAERSLALEARGSYAALQRRKWGLHGTLEIIHAGHSFGSVVSVAAMLEMQWY